MPLKNSIVEKRTYLRDLATKLAKGLALVERNKRRQTALSANSIAFPYIIIATSEEAIKTM